MAGAMSCPSDGPTSLATATAGVAAASDLFLLGLAFDAIAAELALIAGNPERVDQSCGVLRREPPAWRLPPIASRFRQLAVTAKRSPRALTPALLSLLFDVAAASDAPWSILAPLVSSSDVSVCHDALDRLHRLIAAGRLALDDSLFQALAEVVDSGPDLLRDRASLERVGAVLNGTLSLTDIYLESPHPSSRRLAARLLDLPSALPSPETAVALLGRPVAEFLEPYFAYARATHLDLVDFALGSAERSSMLAEFRAAEKEVGVPLLRDVLGEIGWKALNCGLTVNRIVLVSVGGSFPLLLEPCHADLLDGCPGVRREGERLVFVARGGDAQEEASPVSDAHVVSRFRACNLRHADVLADLLDVAPLTADKVTRMCARMDAIVADFCGLFEAHTDECGTIRGIYARLRAQIQQELEVASPGQPLSAGLTRLAQMFEDPASASDIHTLHGCKRYLHQRGLRLGFKLAERGQGTNRTVTLAIADGQHVLHVLRAIDYVDFEPSGDPARLPYLVRVGVGAYSRHLLHGESSFPKLKFFCYGNEVHCFVTFRNHPAFIRVDFSPPQRGGMIDLEYCGVSKFDLDWHPNPSLTAIETVFRRFDFDIQVTDTRIRARYDKERASSLRQLSDKVEGLFRLVPALMDVDWIIGDLQVSPEARRDVAAAWAEFFLRWGILPLRHVLTADRLGILAGAHHDPAGDREIRWTGTDRYHDRFSVPTPAGFWTTLRRRLAEQGIGHLVVLPAEGPVSQLSVESLLLLPLGRAVARGELAYTGDGYTPLPPSRYRSVHEARLLATVLESPDAVVAASSRLARLAALLEATLRFDVTGSINEYEVQRATLSLPDQTAAICGLRDGSGMLQLALFVEGETPHEHRDADDAPWCANWTPDAQALSAVLRRSNYAPPWTEEAPDPHDMVAARIRRTFAVPNVNTRPAPLPGERIVAGLKASPGRAVGLARIGLQGRRPVDVTGGIIIESALSPSDNPFVFRGAGIVTTGGGILSHAGLLALQFHKPGIVVAGRLERQPSGGQALLCTRLTRRDLGLRVGAYDVVEQHDVTAREERVEDGDVVVVDADAGTLLVLGHQPDTLALHDELRRLAASARLLAAARTDPELLAQRGAMIRARHQLNRLLGRMQDPVLARHAASELLVGEAGSDPDVQAPDKARLVAALCANERVAGSARAAVRELRVRVLNRLVMFHVEAMRLIPSAADPVEVLALRMDVLRLSRLLDNIDDILEACAIPTGPRASLDLVAVDAIARERMLAQRDDAVATAIAHPGPRTGVRHVLRQLGQISRVVGEDVDATAVLERRRAEEDDRALQGASRARVLSAVDGGAELWPLVGGKAANLAEAARLGPPGLIPPWFVVSDGVFREVLSRPVPGDSRFPSLATLIEVTLATRDAPAAQKATAIRRAWEAMDLPADVTAAVVGAYRDLAKSEQGPPAGDPLDDDPLQPFVAVRSSAREEDAEAATRAGEFDTFLFVRGERALCEYLKRAWSGLWNERAIHNRAVLGITGEVGGGVLVQRMVWARVSGVLHTINLAGGQWREMVINVGLGIGEGIVSGAVAADQVIVSKDWDTPAGPLRFRYITNDKRERVVFDRGSGSGTRRVETLYHQRLRPALEYVELCDLVQAAARLEAAFRQPLDIEFAITGEHLRLLQVRPIPAAYAMWRDTIERHPLPRRST